MHLGLPVDWELCGQELGSIQRISSFAGPRAQLRSFPVFGAPQIPVHNWQAIGWVCALLYLGTLVPGEGKASSFFTGSQAESSSNKMGGNVVGGFGPTQGALAEGALLALLCLPDPELGSGGTTYLPQPLPSAAQHVEPGD